MTQDRIQHALSRLYDEGHRLVFWNDPEGEFAASVESHLPNGVSLILLDGESSFALKIRLETGDLTGRYLLYTPNAEPDPLKDWLLDMRLYSRTFRADAVSILLEDLGLANQAMRDHLKARAKFLRNKDRVEKLKRWISPQDHETDLDTKMLAVLTRADQPDALSVALRLLVALSGSEGVDLASLPKSWNDIVAFDLEQPFWSLMERQFAYRQTQASLRDLLFRLLVTDFAHSLNGLALPESLQHFQLTDTAGSANASVFASRWRNDLNSFQTYQAISEAVADALNLQHNLQGLDYVVLKDVETFADVEKLILAGLRDQVIQMHGTGMEWVRELINSRRDRFWAKPLMADSNAMIAAFVACYAALEAATDFFELKAQCGEGLSFTSAESLWTAYRDRLFRFDQLYRQFLVAHEVVEVHGWQLLQSLKIALESAYTGWFMPQLAHAFEPYLEGGQGLLSNWQLGGVSRQDEFYDLYVRKPLELGNRSRVFVIISDAFRYEAAEELTGRLKSTNRMTVELDALLGVLPSYTALGMAALLPHKRIDYRATANVDLLVDGLPTSSLEQRSAILDKIGGVAIKADNLIAMGKENGRDFVRGYRVVYVYHDQIDALGDKAVTEGQTFDAVAKAIDELAALVRFIMNNLNGSLILLTADHGFIYQDSALEEADKSNLEEKPSGALKSKKRYLIGENLGQSPKAWSGNTGITAGTSDSLDFWVPKGNHRFHFTGGARFVHGGAMPQEIMIPVISVKENDSEQAKSRPVGLSLLGSVRKVVTNKQRFDFIQTEAISERVLPRTVTISLRDGEQLISNQATLTFDSNSGLLDERKKSIMLTILAGQYDRQRDYALVIRDAETQAEIDRIPFKVDLAFSNDF